MTSWGFCFLTWEGGINGPVSGEARDLTRAVHASYSEKHAACSHRSQLRANTAVGGGGWRAGQEALPEPGHSPSGCSCHPFCFKPVLRGHSLRGVGTDRTSGLELALGKSGSLHSEVLGRRLSSGQK